MNTKELIEQLEKSPNFAENPPVQVLFTGANGELIKAVVTDVARYLENVKPDAMALLIDHQCPKPTTPKPVDRYFWNGKLLADLSRDELEAAFVLMLPLDSKTKPETKA